MPVSHHSGRWLPMGIGGPSHRTGVDGNPSAAARALIGAARCALARGESVDELIAQAMAMVDDIGHEQLRAAAAELA